MKYTPQDLRRAHEELTDALHYSPGEGVFRWKYSPSPRAPEGARAGTFKASAGGVYLTWRGREWSAARLAVFYVTAQMPVGRVRRLTGPADRTTPFSALVYRLPDGRRFHGAILL